MEITSHLSEPFASLEQTTKDGVSILSEVSFLKEDKGDEDRGYTSCDGTCFPPGKLMFLGLLRGIK